MLLYYLGLLAVAAGIGLTAAIFLLRKYGSRK